MIRRRVTDVEMRMSKRIAVWERCFRSDDASDDIAERWRAETWPWAFVIAAFVVTISSVPAIAQTEQDDATQLQAIRDAWAVQANEIQTARIIMRHINRLAEEPTDWEGVMAAFGELARIGDSGDSEAVAREVKQCVTKVSGPSKSPEWPELTIIVDGDDVRNIVKINGEMKGDWGYRKGASARYFPGLRGVNVESGHSVDARFGIAYVRPTLVGDAPWSLIPSEQRSRISLECGDGQITCQAQIDNTTKILTSSLVQGSSARIRGGLAEFAGGVIVPTFGIDVGMGADGRVRTIKAFIVEHAEFNLPLEPEELAVSVPEGTRIADERVTGQVKVGFAATSGDPVILADEMSKPRTQGKSNTDGVSQLRFWLCVTALLLGTGMAIGGGRRLLQPKS